MNTYRDLLKALSKYFPYEVHPNEHSLITQDELKAIFSELTAACEELDMEKMEACGNKLRTFDYPEDKREIIDRIIEAIGMMDTEIIEEQIKNY